MVMQGRRALPLFEAAVAQGAAAVYRNEGILWEIALRRPPVSVKPRTANLVAL